MDMHETCALSNSDNGCPQSSEAQPDAYRRLGNLTGLQSDFTFLINDPKARKKTIELIINNGTAAAFVSYYSNEFRHNWAAFAGLMRRQSKWKIANNRGTKDEFAVQEHGYVFTAGLHEQFRRRIEGRLEVLLWSGINGLWSKWENKRFPASGLRHDEKIEEPTNGSPGDPMSFEN